VLLVLNADAAVTEWVRRRVPWVDGFGGARAIGVAREGRLIAGVVFDNYRRTNVEVTIASDDPAWCRKGVLAGLFAYPYETLRVRRITALIPAGNERSIKLCKGLGFTAEGVHRALFPDGSDGISLGLLRENCRWLRGTEHVVPRQAA
jgi:RimJ/RimL family protein N-acetyltransferase